MCGCSSTIWYGHGGISKEGLPGIRVSAMSFSVGTDFSLWTAKGA